MARSIRLGVNIDHVATLRQARGTTYPDPFDAALTAQEAGVHGITLHLREDRRHIQDHDVTRITQGLSIPVNLEMAVTQEMQAIALAHRPANVCLVPEKREELTTEGGLDVLKNEAAITALCSVLAEAGIAVSLFIAPELAQIEAAKKVGAPVIELHTGRYADTSGAEQLSVLEDLRAGAKYAHELGLVVNAGHGLTLDNLAPICHLTAMNELNIGHALIADALMMGMSGACRAYLDKIAEAS